MHFVHTCMCNDRSVFLQKQLQLILLKIFSLNCKYTRNNFIQSSKYTVTDIESVWPQIIRIIVMGMMPECKNVLFCFYQAWELRMEKSAEKRGPGGRRMPPVGVHGAMTLWGSGGKVP